MPDLIAFETEDPIFAPTKEKNMADLPESVSQHMMAELQGNISASSQNTRNAAAQANSVLLLASSRNFDELGTVESRANSVVLATPAASPTTQAGS